MAAARSPGAVIGGAWQRYRDGWLARRIPPANRITLDQRRIFILPTRQGAAFAVALLLMLLAGINYQNSLAYGLTFLLFSLALVAMLHTYRNLAGLQLAGGGASPVFAGEAAGFRLRLESDRRAHQAIALGWRGEALILSDVPAGESVALQVFHPAPKRGWLRPERLRVESRFPLGLFVAWSWLDLDVRALVYPRPLEAAPPPRSGEDRGGEEGQRQAGQGADDFQGLRPYQPGDSRRRLDWKAFSRGQGLLVKDFTALAGSELWLDFSVLDGDTETRLSWLCQAVLDGSARQLRFGLRLPGVELSPATGDNQRDAALQALALFGRPV
ncbi:DUF58 domain-containing protein [Pseudomonas oryzihabitans]|uniref:Uncharacterized protein (DUF58 family) n=1 Tax=Pseudomonas oryzihabitans TaxID=47885 RepID=A0AAJ2F0Y1_9PSED|nr:uncharacterized protein (DUF58 family) [Pseudomonas psychrotolerans]